MGRVENIFNNPPKPLKLRLYYWNNVKILMDTSEEARIAQNPSSSLIKKNLMVNFDLHACLTLFI